MGAVQAGGNQDRLVGARGEIISLLVQGSAYLYQGHIESARSCILMVDGTLADARWNQKASASDLSELTGWRNQLDRAIRSEGARGDW